MKRVLLSSLVLLAAGCSRNQNDGMSLFHEDGRVKPSIAVATFLDMTPFDASWSLSEELTAEVANKIGMTGKIFVHVRDEAPYAENPFSPETSWMKREFEREEFVVFLELVEHEFVPVSSKGANIQEASHNLNMAVRLRVVDLRGETPKVILQEMIRDNYFVPKTLSPNDYAVDVWGTENFRKSPMGIAHVQLAADIAERIADYVLLAKGR